MKYNIDRLQQDMTQVKHDMAHMITLAHHHKVVQIFNMTVKETSWQNAFP